MMVPYYCKSGIQNLPGKQAGAAGGAARARLERCASGITALSICAQDPFPCN